MIGAWITESKAALAAESGTKRSTATISLCPTLNNSSLICARTSLDTA